MVKIADAINTYNLAIEIILKNNYELFTKKKDEDYILYLKKNDFIEFSEEPLSLLSIMFIKENNIHINKDRINLFLHDYSSLAIKIILEKKYKLNISTKYTKKWYDWVATKKDDVFIAQSPLKLLGLILIIDFYGDDWYSVDIPFYLNEIEER